MYLRLILLFILSIGHYIAIAQPFSNSGRLPLYNIRPDEYQQAHPQNHCILESNDGKILVGNNGGIITYDGSEWRKLIGLESKALTIVKDSISNIYVGGENEIGYLDIDSLGELFYNSILKTFPDSLQSFGRAYSLEYINNSIILFTADKIFEIKNKRFNSMVTGIKYGGSFIYKNNLFYLIPGDGIFSWNNGAPKRVAQDFNLTDNRIFIVDTEFNLCYWAKKYFEIKR